MMPDGWRGVLVIPDFIPWGELLGEDLRRIMSRGKSVKDSELVTLSWAIRMLVRKI